MSYTNKQPNIVLILCDQLRFDFIGAYQKERFIETPNIDALAAEGCRFENAYSPNPVCIPARHNLFTGLTDRWHGFDDNYFGPDAKACPWYLPTFAQILNDSGYRTAAVGKMHFQPERRCTGFEIFQNADEVVKDIALDEYAMDLRAHGFTNVASYHGVRNVLYMQPQESCLPLEWHGSYWTADKAIEFLNHQTSSPVPFLLCVGFKDPHPPFDVPPTWAHRCDGKIPRHTSSVTPLSKLAEENKSIADLPDEENIQRMRELYACAIEFVDYNVGRIVDALRKSGQLENTLLIFTSDHGEMLGDLDTYQKFLPHDPSCRIPLILFWKDKILPSVRTEFADLNDILPTMLDAAGAAYPGNYELPGEPLLKKEGKKNRQVQYVEHQHDSKRWCCLRDARYKYVHFYGDQDQLFDMQNDPQERINLLYAGMDENAQQAQKRLRTLLLDYEARYGLKGYVENGEFKTFPPYEIHPHRECCFPSQTIRWPGDEEKLDSLETEILNAIRNEPIVKLSRLHIKDLLIQNGGFSEEQYAHLVEEAKKAGCW